MAGFSRPLKRLLGLWVMLVNVLTGGSWVFPPETPRGESRHGVLRESATWLSARPAAADTPSAGGSTGGRQRLLA